MNPLLRLGSSGSAVNGLQTTLNEWDGSVLPPLNTDSLFGMKTDAKVREFQRKKNISSDGVVGPITWNHLDLVFKIVESAVPELAAASRTVALAHTALQEWGWPPVKNARPVHHKNRIMAAYPEPLADGSERFPQPSKTYKRQGGVALARIFATAGHPSAPKCQSIQGKAWDWWQPGLGEAAVKRTLRNTYDIPSWCGIFCYYLYKSANIRLTNWVSVDQAMKSRAIEFRELSANEAFPGCMGHIWDNTQHHYMVVDVTGDVMTTIEGNLFGPAEQKDFKMGYQSVIGTRTKSVKKLADGKIDHFYFPKLFYL